MHNKNSSYIEENIEYNWVLWIWEDERDFIAWEDVDIKKLKEIPYQDRVWKVVDQNYGDYTHACTMMSTYSWILSIFNKEEKEEEKEEIIKEAIKEWYKVGDGRWTRLWVKTACKVWNTKNLNKKVMYIKTYVWSEQYKIAIEKGLPIVHSYRTSSWYWIDRRKDWIVDWKGFDNFTGWHAIVGFGSERGLELEHLNTYPKRKYNQYGVRHLSELVKNWVYYPWCYIIAPVDTKNQIEEIKKRKMVKAYMKLGDWISENAISKKTKEVIRTTNDYFRSVWF